LEPSHQRAKYTGYCLVSLTSSPCYCS
jgi:hypothetical protein